MFRACASQNVTKDERTSISLPDPARFSFVCPLFWRLYWQEPGKARGIYLMWMEWWNIKYHFKMCWSYRTLQKNIWYPLYSLAWRVLPWIFHMDSKLAQTNSLQFDKFLPAQHSLLYEEYFTRPQGILVTSITNTMIFCFRFLRAAMARGRWSFVRTRCRSRGKYPHSSTRAQTRCKRYCLRGKDNCNIFTVIYIITRIFFALVLTYHQFEDWCIDDVMNIFCFLMM